MIFPENLIILSIHMTRLTDYVRARRARPSCSEDPAGEDERDRLDERAGSETVRLKDAA